ncbi:FMN-binding negative transcriptional regulator [Bradyrhizobium sp. I1.7.5]|uniref:FMN-binding negative transcriptional regulator n=1 Tax=Bradyrhizobium sp. I1.7.5 TaxID=3156363 RepID=UPI003397F85C
MHAYGPVEFFDDADRLREVVTPLTDMQERSGKDHRAVSDARAYFIKRSSRGLSFCDCKLYGSMARGR